MIMPFTGIILFLFNEGHIRMEGTVDTQDNFPRFQTIYTFKKRRITHYGLHAFQFAILWKKSYFIVSVLLFRLTSQIANTMSVDLFAS
jgi:hypothetical protein